MNEITEIQNLIFVIRNKQVMIDRDLAELYFIEHCKDNKADIRELKQAIDMLIDRTKPAKIGFKTD